MDSARRSGTPGDPTPVDAPGGAPTGDGGAAGAALPERSRAGTNGTDPVVNRLAATVARLRRQVEQAQFDADGRSVIELAKGVLVERLHCAPAEAARQLEDLAAETDLPVLHLAAEIINQAARDQVAEVTKAFLTQASGGRSYDDPEENSGTTVATRLRTAESGVLAAADTQAVADSLLTHALRPLDAVSVAVWAVAPDGSMSLAGAAGFRADEAARWHYVPPGVTTPAYKALLERQPVWLPSFAETGLPSVGRHDTPDGGRVAIPTGTGGRLTGVLEICWPGSLPPRSPQIERQLEALAQLCAHTLETRPAAGLPGPALSDSAYRDLTELIDLVDGLYDPALVLRPQIDADGHLIDFRIHHTNPRFVDPVGRPRSSVTGALLLEAYPLAAGQSGLFDKVERVYATGEPFRADDTLLTTLVDQVPLTSPADISISRHSDSVLLIWRVKDQADRLASLLQHAQRLGRVGGFEENLATGEITWNDQMFTLFGLRPTATPIPLTQLPAHAHADDETGIGRFLRTLLHQRRSASTAFRLKRPDGIIRHLRVVAEPVLDGTGHVLLVRGAYQDISAQHWTEVALAATRDQLAHTEQQAAENNRLTLKLQRAIMPPTRGPLDAAGLRVAVRYRPAEDDHLVGGDWYDAVVLPSGRVLLCVGDVAGHGIEAATGMVVLRNALRGLATTGAGPGQLLRWLNLVAHHLTDYVTGTAVCGLYDPGTRTLEWARAGHLPPVLVRDGRATALPLIGGMLLGGPPDSQYEEGRLTLEADDVLLLYTDGLVERRDTSMGDTLDRLLVTAGRPAPSLEDRLDHLLTHSDADTDDDTCLIGIHLPPS
ncbi:SpoIIE family protein phosphatase [Actinoallomurus liliacearum]|uniref:SpoIIE family protein phosphatase n=1 Tax=Actinoallomurus liliacearum TaxID=1080073 RepID=A0ABP8T995_9ACTN